MATARTETGAADPAPEGWIAWGKRINDEMTRTRLTLVAAGVAFYGLLGLFPGLGALMAVGGLVADPSSVAQALSQLDRVMPADAAKIITTQAQEVAGSSGDGLGLVAIFGICLTLYSASKGMQALIDGLNMVNGREDTRGFLAQTALKLALTAGLILGVLFCVGVAVVVPVVLAWLPLPPALAETVTLARWPVLLVIAAAGLALTYRVAPAGAHASWSAIVPGAAMACIAWLVGTVGFALYVRMFGSYQETFGALGGVVILLMWLWLSATVVLLGALMIRLRRERREGAAPAAAPKFEASA